MKIERSKEFWQEKAKLEGDSPIGAGRLRTMSNDDFDTEAMARAIYEHEGFAADYVPDWNALRPESKARLIGEAGALIARYLTRRDEKAE